MENIKRKSSKKKSNRMAIHPKPYTYTLKISFTVCLNNVVLLPSVYI